MFKTGAIISVRRRTALITKTCARIICRVQMHAVQDADGLSAPRY